MAQRSRIRKQPIIIPPPIQSNTPATLIFIHRYNFVGSQFTCDPPGHLNVAHHIHKSPALQHVKIIIPEALPSIHPSVTKDVWYDIPSPIPQPGNPKNAQWQVEFGHKDNNFDDMEVTLDYFESLVKSEIEMGTPASRIVFFGESQGAGLVVLFLLTRRLAADLGATISYAGFNPTDLQTVLRMQRDHGMEGKWGKESILFMLHGKEDPLVPLEISRAWRDQLEGFRDRGQGIARIEWKLLEGVRHGLTSKVWPLVREILENTVPVGDQKPPHKL
jgi:predicted esterase